MHGILFPEFDVGVRATCDSHDDVMTVPWKEGKRMGKKIAVINDLSGFGRCSLTAAIPVISVMGAQPCPLPTAILSAQTGYPSFYCDDYTEKMEYFRREWEKMGVAFDGIYTGYVANEEQIMHIFRFLDTFHVGNPSGRGKAAERRRPFLLVDPVMGDDGRAYQTYTPAMCAGMERLAALADVITPNRTEAAILLGEDYEALRLDTEADCRRWAEALSLEGRRSVVLTGAAPGQRDRAGAGCFDRTSGRTDFVSAPLAPGQFHGTGDLFASVLTGALVRGYALAEAAQLAADFTSLCALRTGGLPVREGLDFEPLLWRLGQAAEGHSPQRRYNQAEQHQRHQYADNDAGNQLH